MLTMLMAALTMILGAASRPVPAPEHPHVVFMIGEDEYHTWETLPEFAKKELEPRGYRVTIVNEDKADKNNFPGLVDALRSADLLFVSTRRRTPPSEQLNAVRAFLAAGADVNEKRPDLATPLLIAIVNGHEDLVDLLLDKGADPNAEGGTTGTTLMGVRARPTRITLKTPTYREQLRDVGTEGGNGSNNTWGRPLQAAVHLGNWTLSDDRLLVIFDRMRVIRSLIKHGADVNGRNTDMEPRSAGNRYRRRLVGLTAFLSAAKSADVEVMRLLVENGADPKMNTLLNITPLMLTAGIAWAAYQDTASEEQVLDAVKYLVEELGADVNFVADTGETAMHAAAYRGANSVVQYLFDKGAKLDVVDKIGRTPLTVAEGVEYGNSFAAQPHTAELLRKLGAKHIPCPGLCSNIIPKEALPPEEPAK